MTDIFNRTKSSLSPETIAKIDALKAAAEDLMAHYCFYNREISIARTELESSVMWAVKGLCRIDQEPSNSFVSNV